MAGHTMLDARSKPPAHIRELFKHCQKSPQDDDHGLGDFSLLAERHDLPFNTSQEAVQQHMQEFCRGSELDASVLGLPDVSRVVEVYECTKIPGLYYFPHLVSPQAQLVLLEKIFKRDLHDQAHQTNVHMHYDVDYPSSLDRSSFFDLDSSVSFPPKDPSCHKPLTVHQFLEKKLRWITLGGQYNWTRKVYPAESPPPFPDDIKRLLEGVFDMKAEAAIVNLYSPGDTLSVHRDVSEFCNRPLISVSVGCECIFVVGLEDADDSGNPRVVHVRLRSGDAVVMSGESRFAWHGVPKVLADTCPDWLADWPGEQHPHWSGWMRRKRINLNVRQMYE